RRTTPHRPTGATISRAELEGIAPIAVSAGARIPSDEAYRWLEMPGGEPLAPPMRDITGGGPSGPPSPQRSSGGPSGPPSPQRSSGGPSGPPSPQHSTGISVGTLSKPFGLPGLRIGWIAGSA